MSKDISDNQDLPSAFSFALKVGAQEVAFFQEISGLESKIQPIEYRQKDKELFSTSFIPEKAKSCTLILKRGLVVNKNAFSNWLEPLTSFAFQQKTMVVELHDETGKIAMSWTLTNAFPTKISALESNFEAEHLAVESLELTYESLKLTAH